ncbi:MAG: YdcF family protein [Pseudobdellovibrionaceae bacterium]|jgi:uncharacterized SAM-binding protein YcdF (DUF218 family)|nr:YdcF family protein [Pseudobdellovibrionaceae bacterium]
MEDSFFFLSKILWEIVQPLTLIGVGLISGYVFRKFFFGKILLRLFISIFVICGFSPLGEVSLRYLENSYAIPQVLPEDIDGIIVLGGSISVPMSYSREQVQLNDNAERITEMVKLSRIFPQTKIVFSGGDWGVAHPSHKESKLLNSLLNNIGFDTSRILIEDQSRNTYENYLYSYRKFHPQVGEKWLLMTSAFHMPRAVAVFHSNGWDVIPYPAGYLTSKDSFSYFSLDVLGNYYKLHVAVKEFVGIIAYTLTERIKSYDAPSEQPDV